MIKLSHSSWHLLTLGSLLISLGMLSCSKAPESQLPVSKQQISGTIVAAEWLGKEGDDCDLNESLSYKDLGSGASVKVKNAKGEIIALGKIGTGKTKIVSGKLYCSMSFLVADVPGSDFYSMNIGSERRGDLTYTKEELAKQNWQLELSLR